MTMVTYTRTTATVIAQTVNITPLHITLHRHKRSDYYFKQPRPPSISTGPPFKPKLDMIIILT